MREKKCESPAILKAIYTEENWAKIARQHKVSREWIRRIAAAHGIKKRISFEQAVNLVQPFLKYAHKQSCWRCGAELEPLQRTHKLCEPCLKLRTGVGAAKYFLRRFIATGSHRALTQAAYVIRKHGYSPKDFESV